MGVFGNLSTMTLPDLLQWAGVNKKAGILELERNKVCKQIAFRKGRVIACSSDEAHSRFGQFLLTRGKITPENLREALALQEVVKQNLGTILIEMGVLTAEEVRSQIAARAEETIYSLFDWEDGVFRFREEAAVDANTIEVSLSVDDVLLRGIQRHDELKRIRSVLTGPGVVLRSAKNEPPTEVRTSEMARRIFNLIDGKRTLDAILKHAHAPEFLVLKFLFHLHQREALEISEIHAVEPAAGMPGSPSNDGSLMEAISSAGCLVAGGFKSEIEVAERLIERGEVEASLVLLNACARAHPDDGHLKELIARAERTFLSQVRTEDLSGSKIPVLIDSEGAVDDNLTPDASYLLSLIDGKTDIKSILWLAPMREVEVLRALQQMLERGLIRLDQPEDAPRAAPAAKSAAGG